MNYSKSILNVITCFLVFMILFSCAKKDENKNIQPNIIIIYADDLGWMDVSYNGSEFYQTPNIDHLAEEGMVFTDAYANAPFCSPSRACLISGLQTPRHEIYIPGGIERGPAKARRLIPPENKHQLDTSFVTVAEALKTQGYYNGYIGKWHLAGFDKPEYEPDNQGFDFYNGGYHRGTPPSYFYPYKQNEEVMIKGLQEGGEPGEYLTDRLTLEAVKFIERNQNAPFFLVLGHYAVHVPIEAKPELVKKYENKEPQGKQDSAVYAAMVESLDNSVGKIVEKLDELNMSENTIVIFYSDNGGLSLATSNKPLRGGKGNLYEGGIRVPLIFKWPGKIKKQSVSQEPVNGTDIYPTLTEIAEISNEELHLDGKSIWPILSGNKSKLDREAIYWYIPAYLDSYDSAYYERWDVTDRIVLNEAGRIKQDSAIEVHPSNIYPAWRLTPANAIRKGDFKLIEYFDTEEIELYSLKNDIGETRNLAEEMPGKVNELYDLLSKWRKSVNASYPLESNPEYDPSIYKEY